MAKRNKQIKKTLILSSLILGVIISISHFYIEVNSIQSTANSIAMQNGDKKIIEREKRIKNFIKNLFISFATIQEESGINKNIVSLNTLDSENLKSHFYDNVKYDHTIAQIRLIDSKGNEKINITRDLEKDTIKIMPDNSLQNKAHRDYFIQASNAPLGTIISSPMDLNIEHNKIEMPFKPVYRIMMPLGKHKFKGVLIVNYFIEPFLNRIADMPLYDAMITNEKGEFLYHYKSNKAWSHYTNKPYLLKDEFPNQFKKILDNGLVKTDKFISKKITYGSNHSLYLIMQFSHSRLEKILQDEENKQFYISILLVLLPLAFSLYATRYIKKLVDLLEQSNKEMELKQKLLDKDKEHKLLFEDVPVPYFIIDTNCDIVSTNKKARKKFNLDSFNDEQKASFLEFLEPDNQKKFLSHFEYFDISPEFIILRLKTIEGYKIFKVFIYNNPINEKYFIISAIDVDNEYLLFDEILKKEELNKKILEQTKMVAMGEMLANIAHQWKQPLHYIKNTVGFIELKSNKNKLDKEYLHSSLNKIDESVEYLSETINTFTNYLKDSKEYEVANIKDEVNKAIQIIEGVLNNNNIALTNNFNAIDSIYCKIIPSEFQQVIVNILNNAKDILIEKEISNKQITITIEEKEDIISLEIEDNGGGIASDVLPKIFEPYFTTKHKAQGTGLGLHMSYKIITESLKGRIYAQNTNDGVKFIIELPLING